jgi:hypothetical protein
MEESTPSVRVVKYRRSFGQPKRKKPTSPRRKPWAASRVRQERHAKGIILWTALIFGREIVAKRLLEGMYAQLERQGVLDKTDAPAVEKVKE